MSGGIHAETATDTQRRDCLRLGKHVFRRRLIVGTGKYATYELMRETAWTCPGRSVSPWPCAGNAGGQGGPQHPRLPRPEALHAPAQHGRLLHGRRRHADRAIGPRNPAESGKPRCRLGQAGSARRQEDAAARPSGHTARPPSNWWPKVFRCSATRPTIRSSPSG